MARQHIREAIAVDAMGGDFGPSEIVEAVALVLKHLPEIRRIDLIGDQRQIKPKLRERGVRESDRLVLWHTDEVITMEDKPVVALKQKRNASMVRALDLVRNGDCAAMVSCGNTGSLMAGGTLRVRRMPGVERPALATVIPSKHHHTVLIDAGANPQAKPEHLVHNALLGSRYAEIVLAKKAPRVGLLSIGTEEGKGNELVLAAHTLLKQMDGIIRYQGLVEGFQVFDNQVDVIVCDGFTGNIVLKSCESLFHMLKDFIKEEIQKNPVRIAGALFSAGAFKNVKDALNPDRYGGAPLLGLRGHVLKAHGGSNRFAIMNAIRIASEVIAHDLNALASQDIEAANTILEEHAAAAIS